MTMWIVYSIGSYLLIGLLFGVNHVIRIKKPILLAGRQEEALREMVSMHQYTPQGADYYTKLQEIHITKGEFLAEYKIWKASAFKYEFQAFSLAVLLWPYFITYISLNKKKK